MPPPNKKRKLKTSAVEEVTFDYNARQEYLTGFHKRKVERQKIRQDLAKRRAREERIEGRKKIRDERKADLEMHVKEVNALLSKPNGNTMSGTDSDEEDQDIVEVYEGLEDPIPVVDHEDEYVDEDKYTTVTVEEVDISRHGLSKARKAVEDGNAGHVAAGEPPEPDTKLRPGARRKAAPDKDKLKRPKKKRNFRYESKVDRKVSYLKVKAKNAKAAKARKGD